jgi:hypothetical protein
VSPGFRVHFLRQFEAGATRFRQADQFFQPGRTRRLQVQPRVESLQRAPDGPVNRELVAARMHAQLEARRKPVPPDRVAYHREIRVELGFEAGQITLIIDPVVDLYF